MFYEGNCVSTTCLLLWLKLYEGSDWIFLQTGFSHDITIQKRIPYSKIVKPIQNDNQVIHGKDLESEK